MWPAWRETPIEGNWLASGGPALAGLLDVIENPTVEQFRRLAQSSPWRWRTAEFAFVADCHTAPVHAWIRRPGSLRVEAADGTITEITRDAVPFAGTTMMYSDGVPRQPQALWASDTIPEFDADGLVSALPSESESRLVDWDDPFYENYRWIAMLNPIEIVRSPHDHSNMETVTVLSDVRAVEHHGRPAWQVIARTTDKYDARCECCPLLSGHWDYAHKRWVPGPPVIVRLDVQTGICVYVGSAPGESANGSEMDVKIMGVDLSMPDSLFVRADR